MRWKEGEEEKVREDRRREKGKEGKEEEEREREND
jgi:hypothetical protein